MRISKCLRTFCALTMCLLMSNIAEAAAPSRMISTNSVVNLLDRTQTENDVQEFLLRGEVQSEMLARGVSASEVSNRLASLSDQELRDLSTQIHQAKAGGDILIAILVIVLIIFLIRRI